MPRETNEITKYDEQLYKLGKQILKVVKTRKDWIRFRDYMAFNYKKLESFNENK